MNNIVDFPDPYSYVLDDDEKIIGVSIGENEIYNHSKELVSVNINGLIQKRELRELMIMWLSLNYPDVIYFDEE